jgi:hypothetical protein
LKSSKRSCAPRRQRRHLNCSFPSGLRHGMTSYVPWACAARRQKKAATPRHRLRFGLLWFLPFNTPRPVNGMSAITRRRVTCYNRRRQTSRVTTGPRTDNSALPDYTRGHTVHIIPYHGIHILLLLTGGSHRSQPCVCVCVCVCRCSAPNKGEEQVSHLDPEGIGIGV